MTTESGAAYGERFFERIGGAALRSAEAIVPLVLELTKPGSVVDVGCGQGAWLHVFREHGVDDVVGVDGDYVDPASLLIPRECFRAADLTAGIELERGFDLAVSLEVAEHLPERHADTFVAALTGLAPIVLFSAAIPFQGGTHHVNEQWQDYWVERFRARGFVPVDCVRPRVWNDTSVAGWYAQNVLVYARPDALERLPELARAAQRTNPAALSVIHPRLLRRVSTQFARRSFSLWRFLGWRFKGLHRSDYRLDPELGPAKEFRG